MTAWAYQLVDYWARNEDFVQCAPRKLRSVAYDRPIDLSKYEKVQWMRQQLDKVLKILVPTGN
jgi:arylsulfatase